MSQRSELEKLAELIENREAVIRMQSACISELFLMLLQHMTVKELDNCGVVGKINEIAKLL